jgi:hypothetical protein
MIFETDDVLRWWEAATDDDRQELFDKILDDQTRETVDAILTTIFGRQWDFEDYLDWLARCEYPMGRYVKLPEGVDKNELNRWLLQTYGKQLPEPEKEDENEDDQP